MWTEKQRKAASERAKARWANPEYRLSQGKAISKSPCCPKCGETEIVKFYVDKEGKRTNKLCRECHKAACNERWHSRSWLDRWSSRAPKYGFTKEWLIEMYNVQQGKCAICSKEPKTARGLHIDHCHSTGKVRGLLCHGCNVGIGALGDSPEIISKALNYLKG